MEYIEITAKTVEEALTNAAIELETTTDNVEYEVVEKGSNGLLGLFSNKLVKIMARKKAEALSIEDKTRDFLENVFKAMNIDVEIKIEYDEIESSLNVDLSGAEMGLLIGKRGQTLDSLQYIVSLVVNKSEDRYVKVKVDTEDYRKRRKETLESLARNIAYKVKRSRRPVSLEPMNPYERRIIHAALQNDRYVTTKSEGEDPYRHVVVYMKPNASRYVSSSSSRYSTVNNRYARSGSAYSSGYSSRYRREESEEKETSSEE